MSTFSPKSDSNVYSNFPSNINSNPTSIPNPSMQIQQATAQPTSRINNPEKRKKYKLILHRLAIAELVLGIFSVLLGIIISGIVGSNPRSAYRILYAVDPDYYEYSYYKTSTRCHWRTTYGEGIWCGLWIIIAGALGIYASKENSSNSMINSHMAFSIVGAVFATVMFGIGVPLSLQERRDTNNRTLLVFFCLLCIFSFSSIIIQIISSCYGCLLTNCCEECCQTAAVPFNTYPVTYSNQLMAAGIPINTIQTGFPSTQAFQTNTVIPVSTSSAHPAFSPAPFGTSYPSPVHTTIASRSITPQAANISPVPPPYGQPQRK